MRLEETISARAKAKERTMKSTTCQKSDKSLPTIDTKKEVAKRPSVSPTTNLAGDAFVCRGWPAVADAEVAAPFAMPLV